MSENVSAQFVRHLSELSLAAPVSLNVSGEDMRGETNKRWGVVKEKRENDLAIVGVG